MPVESNTLKAKTTKTCIEKGVVNYDGRLSPPFQDLFIAMADEIDTLKKRVDQLEKKQAKTSPVFGQLGLVSINQEEDFMS